MPVSPRSSLFRTLDEASHAVVLLDPRWRIVYLNRSLAGMLGVPRDDLLGQSVRYGDTPPATGEELASLLCPSPELGQRNEVELTIPAAALPTSEGLSLRYHALRDSQGALLGFLGIGARGREPDRPQANEDEHQRLHALLQIARKELRRRYRLPVLIGSSDVARRLRKQVALAASNPVNTVISGRAGGGREQTARMIHLSAPEEMSSSLIPLDCSLLDAELLDGTITAALQQCAHLDVPSIPWLLLLDLHRLEAAAQARLYELLTVEELAMRVLATVDEGWEGRVHRGDFHPALAERLAELSIRLPRLTDRREDIPSLLQYFLESWNGTKDRVFSGFSRGAIEVLAMADWPGELGQLREVAWECWKSATPPLIDVPDLPDQYRYRADPRHQGSKRSISISLDQVLLEVERLLLERALQGAKGNRTKAARSLNISRARLIRRISQLGLTSKDDGANSDP